jgi:hypothetical protein
MNLTKLINEERPKVIPVGWQPVPNYPDGAIYRFTLSGMSILYSLSETEDGKKYHHVSFSRQHRLPGWEEMRDELYSLPWLNKNR